MNKDKLWAKVEPIILKRLKELFDETKTGDWQLSELNIHFHKNGKIGGGK